jgi:HEPN domain-containing protein
MDDRMHWRGEVEHELGHAAEARARGNEGRARVCARRAAGILAREYFSRRAGAPRTSSAVDLLRRLESDSSLPAAAYELVRHLTQPVDSKFRLPPDVDLLGDVRRLERILLED